MFTEIISIHLHFTWLRIFYETGLHAWCLISQPLVWLLIWPIRRISDSMHQIEKWSKSQRVWCFWWISSHSVFISWLSTLYDLEIFCLYESFKPFHFELLCGYVRSNRMNSRPSLSTIRSKKEWFVILFHFPRKHLNSFLC